MRYALLGRVLSTQIQGTGSQQKTKGNTVSCVNLSTTYYSTMGGHAQSNGFVSGKQRGILQNLRSSDLAGNNQLEREGSWKTWKRSPKNWGLIATVTVRMKVAMAHQTTVQAMKEVKRSSMVIKDDDQ